jgi:hypothetical protein
MKAMVAFAVSSLVVGVACGGAATPKVDSAAGGGDSLDKCTFASGAHTPDNAVKLLPWPTKSIQELARGGVAPGGYNTEGYVWDVFVPSTCPPGEMCTDQPPHVIVNEKSSDEWLTNPRQLAVVVRDPTKLQSGVRYKMSIAICGTKSMGASINEGEMRAFEQVVR